MTDVLDLLIILIISVNLSILTKIWSEIDKKYNFLLKNLYGRI